MEGACNYEHHIVDHVPICAVVQKLAQVSISLHVTMLREVAVPVQSPKHSLPRHQLLSSWHTGHWCSLVTLAGKWAYIGSHACPVINQLLCALLHDSGGGYGRCLICQVWAIVGARLYHAVSQSWSLISSVVWKGALASVKGSSGSRGSLLWSQARYSPGAA